MLEKIDSILQLINETINSIAKSKALEDVLVIVSLSYNHGEFYHHRDKLFMLYSKTIFPRFDKCIEITNSHENRDKMIDLKIRNNCSRRNKNSVNDFHDSKLLSINNIDLLTVSASIK